MKDDPFSQLSITLFSFAAKLSALKSLLSDAQLSAYNEKLKASKVKFLEHDPLLSPESLEHLDKCLFS
jgi:hypothetical protein